MEAKGAHLEKFEGHVEAFQFPQQLHGPILTTQHSQCHTFQPAGSNRLGKKRRTPLRRQRGFIREETRQKSPVSDRGHARFAQPRDGATFRTGRAVYLPSRSSLVRATTTRAAALSTGGRRARRDASRGPNTTADTCRSVGRPAGRCCAAGVVLQEGGKTADLGWKHAVLFRVKATETRSLASALRAGQRATCGCQNTASPCYF